MPLPTPLRRRLRFGAAVVLVAIALGTGLGLILGGTSAPTISPSSPIEPTDRAVPAAIATIPLVDQHGRPTDLAALRGRVIVLANFMTSCQKECPITTGALLQVNDTLQSAHLGDKVVVVEVTVDPWRDTPGRMLAYAKRFGVPWTMLSGTPANIAKLWSWFGAFYQRVPEGRPPDTDWQTGKPYAFDIDHSDNVFVLDPSGDERALVQANADVGGNLPSRLADLLSSEGRKNLVNPGFGSWTPAELVQAVGAVLGREIPTSTD